MSTYRVRFLGRENPCRDRDAWGVRLRTLRDDDYFQFFRALTPGPAVASLNPRPEDEWWRAFALLAAREIERVVRDGLIPLEDPTMAALVVIDAQEASRLSRSGEALPDLNLHEEFLAGPVIHEFTL